MSDPFPYVGPDDLSVSFIAASNMTLLRQAPMTADTYMRCAVECIDQKFGKGYAAKHPELVGAFMTTSAIDMHGAVVARAIQDGLEAITLEMQQNRIKGAD